MAKFRRKVGSSVKITKYPQERWIKSRNCWIGRKCRERCLHVLRAHQGQQLSEVSDARTILTGFRKLLCKRSKAKIPQPLPERNAGDFYREYTSVQGTPKDNKYTRGCPPKAARRGLMRSHPDREASPESAE